MFLIISLFLRCIIIFNCFNFTHVAETSPGRSGRSASCCFAANPLT